MFKFTPIKTKQQKDQELEKTIQQPEKVVEKTSRMFDFTPIEVKKEEIVEQPKIKPVIPSLIPEKQPEFGELLFKKIETPEKSITETTKEAVPETKEVIVPEKTHPVYSFFDKMLEATTEGLNKSLERLSNITTPVNEKFEWLVKPIESVVTSAFKTGTTSIPETLLDTTRRLKAFEEIQKTGVVQDELTREQKYATTADKIGKGIEVGVGAANTAFIPITSIFSAAKEVPGLNIPVEVIEWVFGKAGEIGTLGGDKVLNALPISDEDKNSLALPVAELTGLVGMIVLGGSLFKGVSKGVEVVKNKITESKPGTPEYNDAVKEILDTENTDALMDKTIDKLETEIKAVKEKGEDITPEKAKEIVEKVNEEVLLQPAMRYSKEEFKITDDFRGGTWYTSPESKTFDFSQGFGGTIGGPIKTEKTLQIKNPLIIKNADVSEGSFALIDSGYENKLPIKERKLVQDFYEKITKEDVNDKQVNDLITKYLTEEKFSKAEIKKVIDSTNKADATFDLIISKGLREKGYDALILENEYQGEIIDKHIFKLKEETEPEVKPKAKPKAKEEVKPEKIEEKTKEKPQDELIEVFRGETPERVSGNIIKGKTEFGDAPFVSFATDKTLASRFGDKVNTHSLKKSEILDLDLSKDQKALKIVNNEIDLSKEQVKELNKLGYKAISFNNLEPGYKGKEIRYFGDFKIEPKEEVKIKEEVKLEKESLETEAKKYDTAEDFVNSLDILYEDSYKGDKSPEADRLLKLFDEKTAFHGTDAAEQIKTEGYKKDSYWNSGIHFSDTPDVAIDYMKQRRSKTGGEPAVLVNDLSNLKIYEAPKETTVYSLFKGDPAKQELVTKLKKEGYDGMKDTTGETFVWNVEKIKTPKTLTDIWKESQETKKTEEKKVKVEPKEDINAQFEKDIDLDMQAPNIKELKTYMKENEIPFDEKYTIKIGKKYYKIETEGWFDDCCESRELGKTTIKNIEENYKTIMEKESGLVSDISGYIPEYGGTEYGVSFIGKEIPIKVKKQAKEVKQEAKVEKKTETDEVVLKPQEKDFISQKEVEAIYEEEAPIKELYHVTPLKNLKSIKEKGLITKGTTQNFEGEKRANYFTNDYKVVKGMQEKLSGDSVVLRYKTNKQPFEKGGPITDDIEANSYIYKKDIKPEKLEILTKNGWKLLVEEPRLKVETKTEEEIKEVKAEEVKEKTTYQDRIDTLIKKEKSLTENMDKYQKERTLKGIGMEYAGYKRAIEEKPTQIEKAKTRKYLESNHKGKEVEVAGKQGTLTGKAAFGSHEIIFKDKTKKFVKTENIKSEKITDKMVLDYIKDEAVKKIEGKEDLYKIKPEKEVKKVEKKLKEVEPKKEVKKEVEPKEPETKDQKEKKQFQSRVYERMQAEMPDILKDDLTYERMNMKKDVEKAVKLIEKDKQEAYEVAVGIKEPKEGQTSTAVNIALTEKALAEGNNTLAADLIKNRSLAQTRRGQEIVAEKGSVSDNSVSRYVKELINARMETLKTYTFDIRKTRRKTKKQQVMEKIDMETQKAQKKIRNKELDLQEAQKLIDSIICK